LETDRVRALWRKAFGAAACFVAVPLGILAWQPSDLAVEASIYFLLLTPPIVMAFAAGRQLGLYARSLPDEDTIVLLWPLLAAAVAMIAVVLLLSEFAISVSSFAVAGIVLAFVVHRAVRVLFPLDFQSKDFSKFFFILLLPYALGSAMAFDLYWVPFDSETIEAEVAAKDDSGTLLLKPWGPVAEETRVSVDDITLAKSEPGQKIPLRYKPGLLGKGWRSVAR
jgi:hypothetical protein